VRYVGRHFVRHLLHRTGFGELEEFELEYVTHAPEWIRTRCTSYREPSIGEPVPDCEALGLSVSSLNKLYYFTRIAESVPPPRAVVEFGGGYGLLCHVFHSLMPGPPAYASIDLPELLTLQYLFLVHSGIPVRAHTALPIRLEPGFAHLIPVAFLPALDLHCDLFISTFALSETPSAVRELVQESRFFKASSLYLTGQVVDAELWNEYSFEEMDDVRRAVEKLYGSVRVEAMPAVSAWELLAIRSAVESPVSSPES
jgi:hypothetical protein